MLHITCAKKKSAHAIKTWRQDDVSRSARYSRPAEKLFRVDYMSPESLNARSLEHAEYVIQR